MTQDTKEELERRSVLVKESQRNQIQNLFDEEERLDKFMNSLKFSGKVLISDDGDLVTQCRVINPEEQLLFEILKDDKRRD